MQFALTKKEVEKWDGLQKRVATLCPKQKDARAVQFLDDNRITAKPFVKWAGGKAQVLPKIRQRYPKGLGKTIVKYAEPFVGGGAVLFDVLNRFYIKEAYISDKNSELIETYIQIRDNVDELIGALGCLEHEYLSLSGGEQKNYYYDKRKIFNKLKSDSAIGEKTSSLFIFLNKTCFNGLYRVNSKGEFNVPIGSYKNPKICDAENLLSVSKRLQGIKILCGDYTESKDFIDDNTFVYFDPPYRPLSTTSSFTSYAQGGFNDQDQKGLAEFIKEMHDKGARIIASNSDPKNTDPKDDFFDGLYSFLTIERISASRAINSVASGRGRVMELLLSNCGGE